MVKQFAKANKLDCHFSVILGETELKSHSITLKDLKQNKQQSLSRDDCITFFQLSMNYRLLRSLLFQLSPELTHSLSLNAIDCAHRSGLLTKLVPPVPNQKVNIMGLTFNNPVGIAAGLDKDAAHYNALGAMGFGFIEVGTVTPLPQSGNPGRRIFRLPAADAVINRLGFNSKGLSSMVNNLQRRSYSGILGINIGKNRATKLDSAASDYVACLKAVYPYADYIAVNISSPNTPNLRNLQFGDYLKKLLTQIEQQRLELADKYQKRIPIAVKIAPDIDDKNLQSTLDQIVAANMDAIIATNTTITRTGVEHLPHSEQEGGLSGAPLHKLSTAIIAKSRQHLGKQFPIIGVGGVVKGSDAQEKILAGANLVQFYTGFIYRGPQLLQDCVHAITALNGAKP